MSQMSRDLLMILPQIVVLLTAVVALIFEMTRKPKGGLGTVIIGFSAACTISILRLDINTTAFSGTFRIDAFNHWSVIILSISGILISILMRQELKVTAREGTLYSLLTFSILGSLILAGSGDLMFLVLGVLMNSLSGFALAAYAKTDRATEGAMKYFIYGSVTGAIMIFGLTFWAGITGSTLIFALGENTYPSLLMVLGFMGLLAGLGYAASLFPFHFWTPDAFEGSSVSVAAYLSLVPKIGAFFALAQVMKDLPQGDVNWNIVIAMLAVLSMTFGNVVALWQKNLVRLLSYSTIAQAGYFLLGIIAVRSSELALPSLIVFGAAYAAMNIGAFSVIQFTGTKLIDIEGLAKQKPFLAASMTIFLLSLVGIPPLAGFAGKLLLFSAAIDSGFTWLAIVAIVNSVISLAVYMRIIAPMFYKKEHFGNEIVPLGINFVVVVCFCITIIAGIGVQWFF